MITLASIAILVCRAVGDPSGEPADSKPAGEVRYSLSLGDEGVFADDLRVPGADKGNLLLLQSSLAYRHGQQWRASSSVALVTRTQDDTHVQLRVKEAYLGYSAGDFDFTAGKRLVRWGTGYAFTATGVLDPPRIATDPTDRLNLNEGREMLKADWIRGSHDITVAWASAGLVANHRTGMRETLAVRYNVLADGFDTSVIMSKDRGGSTFAGANFTRVFGESVEVHGELAYRGGAAVLLGGKYTARSGVTVIGEFYTPPNTSYYRSAGVSPQAGRQHYGFVRVSKSRLRELPGWKEWDLAASLVVNLDDGSRVAVFDAERRFGNHFSAYTHASAPFGTPWRSEYGMIPYSALISVGVRYQM